MDIQGFEPLAPKGASNLFKTHNVTLIYMEWSELKGVLVTNVKATPYTDTVEQVMSRLVNHMEFSVFSKELGSQLYWEDRLHWSDNIFLVQKGMEKLFRITDQIPSPLKVA